MKHALGIIILTLLLLFIKCSPLDDSQIDEQNATKKMFNKTEFSLIDYSVIESKSVNDTICDEKLLCKIAKDSNLIITHKNVVFDSLTNINVSAELNDNDIIITEKGNYGKSKKYCYYTISATIGQLEDNDYVVIIKRNDYSRGMFRINYDVSKAK